MPAHSLIALGELKRIALFEFIEVKWLTEKLKAIFVDDEYLTAFEDNSLIDAMGVMLFIGLAVFLAIGFVVLFGLLCKGCCIQELKAIKKKLLWNSAIRYSL